MKASEPNQSNSDDAKDADVPAEEGQANEGGVIDGLAELQRWVTLLDATKGRIDSSAALVA